ncbi:MAG: glycine oxidase ThiO [Parvularculaceae bacterium]
MRKADVIIVGGGAIGLMCAWMLARRGVRILDIDSGGPAATHAAAGMLSPSFERSLHGGGDALGEFSRASLSLWREIAPALEEASGVDIDYDESGVLCVALDDLEASVFDADSRYCDRLERNEVLELEPALSSSVRCAWFARTDAQVDPRRVREALKRAIARESGAVKFDSRVVSIETHGARAGRVRLASGESLEAGRIVLATGARIDGLAELPAGAVFPVKGEALAVERIASAPRRVVRTGGAYLCPKSDGRIIIGATELNRDRSLNTDDRRLRELRAAAEIAFPGLEDAAETERWAGLRPATADGAPIIGPAPSAPGLIYALGHYRNGVLLAPASAAAIADLIASGRAGPEIAAFSAARFTELGDS